MNFLNTLSTLGTLTTSAHSSSRAADPVQRARENFVRVAGKQFKLIDANKMSQKGAWYSKMSDGTFNVTLRAGTMAMKLDGENTHINVATLETVRSIFERAIVAAKAGELDAKFAEHAQAE